MFHKFRTACHRCINAVRCVISISDADEVLNNLHLAGNSRPSLPIRWFTLLRRGVCKKLLKLVYFSLNSLWLSHFTATSSIGRGLDQTLDALRHCRAGLVPCAFDTVDLATFIGEVAGVDTVTLPAHMADFDCRNNRLALMGLTQDTARLFL